MNTPEYVRLGNFIRTSELPILVHLRERLDDPNENQEELEESEVYEKLVAIGHREWIAAGKP